MSQLFRKEENVISDTNLAKNERSWVTKDVLNLQRNVVVSRPQSLNLKLSMRMKDLLRLSLLVDVYCYNLITITFDLIRCSFRQILWPPSFASECSSSGVPADGTYHHLSTGHLPSGPFQWMTDFSRFCCFMLVPKKNCLS